MLDVAAPVSHVAKAEHAAISSETLVTRPFTVCPMRRWRKSATQPLRWLGNQAGSIESYPLLRSLASTLQGPGPAAHRYRNTKQYIIASSPPFRIGSQPL